MDKFTEELFEEIELEERPELFDQMGAGGIELDPDSDMGTFAECGASAEPNC